MTKFADSEIVQILPEYLKDSPEVQAISYAIHRQMERYLTYCQSIGVYAMVDTATDSVLDMLALDLNTQYYDEALDIDTKRKLIKNTLKWYMHAGTPAAVKELVEAVFGEGTVTEWFQYGDDPYFFKIVTNAVLTPETDAELSDMIERVTNVRSHLRTVEIHREAELTEHIGILPFPAYHPPVVTEDLKIGRTAELTEYTIPFAAQVVRPPVIAEGYSEEESASGTVYAGTTEYSVTHPAAVYDGYQEDGEAASGSFYNMLAGISYTKQATVSESLTMDAAEVTQVTTAGASAGATIYSQLTS